MDKDSILNNAKNNLQLFEKAQTELINARTGLIDTKAELDKAIQELIIARDSIEEVLKNSPNEPVVEISEPVSAPVTEEAESADEEIQVEEEIPEKKTSRSASSRKKKEEVKKEEPKIELTEEDELDLDFLDEDSSDNDDIDKIEF